MCNLQKEKALPRPRLDLMNADCFAHSVSLLFDLSAGLDMIDYSSLDDRLRNCGDICGTAHVWFSGQEVVYDCRKLRGASPVATMNSIPFPAFVYIVLFASCTSGYWVNIDVRMLHLLCCGQGRCDKPNKNQLCTLDIPLHCSPINYIITLILVLVQN